MSSEMRFSLVFSIALCIAMPAAAQMPYGVFIVPVVVKAPGEEGSNWMTDFSYTNLGDTARKFGAHYFPTVQENTFNGTFAKDDVWVGPGRTFRVEDVIGKWFPGNGTDTKGWLFLADMTAGGCDESYPGTEGIVATRVFNKLDGGKTYGMIVESSLFSINYSALPSVFTGVRHHGEAKPGFRTSVGVANVSTTWLNVEITLFDTRGEMVGQAVRDVKPLSHKQWPLDKLGFSTLSGQGGRLEVRIVDPNYNPCSGSSAALGCMDRCSAGCNGKYGFGSIKAIVPYVSNTDNITGDGETILPVIDQLGVFAWSNDYIETHCPEKKGSGTLLEELARRAAPYLEGELQAPPVFRKVVD